MQTVQRVRNGAIYTELLKVQSTQHVSTAIINDVEKLVYPNALFTVDAVQNSYKYGAELQFKAYCYEKPRLAKRVDKEHDTFRLEVGYMPLNHETAEKLREVADQVDALIGFENYVPTESWKPRKPFSGKLEELIL